MKFKKISRESHRKVFGEAYKEESDESSENEMDDQKQHVLKSNKMKRKYENIPTDASTQSKKKHKNELYKPPTVEELNNLRETENLFNSNLFRLEIDALLAEVKIKSKRKNNLQSWLESFNNSIKALPDFSLLLSELNQNHLASHKFIKHETIFETDQEIRLSFEKPEYVQCFGLYENNSLVGYNLTLNINLTMPKSCFLLKDYLNNRYLVKRWYYLLYVSKFLQKQNLVDDLKIDFHESNHLHPIINLVPKNCDKTTVLIYVTPSEDTFKPTRFFPEQNNCKLDLFEQNIDLEILRNTPTILYNSLLAFDVTLYTNNEFIHEILKDQANIQDGIKLLCVWLQQRELNQGLGAFTETMVLYIIIYLLHNKKINKFMSSYQVIRNFWSFLISVDFLKDSISIGEATSETLATFKQYYKIVILDKTGCYNVASFLNEEIYKKVKLESQIALKYLDESKDNSFHELFISTYPFYLQYDVIINFSESIGFKNKFTFNDEEKSLYIGYDNILIVEYIQKILKKSLNRRILHIVPKIETSGRKLKRFMLGIHLNPNEAFNFIEKGPPLHDLKESALYRDFWGKLCSDRRFKDGSTNVALYFKTNTIRAKRNIIMKIISFIMDEKLRLECKIHYDEFEDVLLFKKLIPNYPSGTNEETCLKIVVASDELSKVLRELPMSLKITGVQGISDSFAYADVFPPIPANFSVDSDATFISSKSNNNLELNTKQKLTRIPRYVRPIECVLQLEHSSKWPNDLQSLRYIKTAYYVEMSKLLTNTHKLLTHPTPQYLDVFYEGLVFRYKLFVPKEIGLVKKTDNDDGLTSFRDSGESLNMDVLFTVLPKIVGALRGIQSLHPSYGPGTALIKRWIRSHLIDEFHVPDVVINLLNASLYLANSYNPSTPQMSFLRFLKFISHLDWNLQIVIVNFNNDLSREIISEVESRFQKNRQSFPSLFILTSYDEVSVFTKKAPSKEILKRVKQLAVESLTFYERLITEQNYVAIKEIFVPNYEGYNVLIRLNPSMNPKLHEQICFSTAKNRTVVDKYKLCETDKIPIVNFDPVEEYLRSLRKNYGRYALFFHDSYGGSVIAVLWHPRVYETSDFKVSKVNGCKIIEDKIVFNFDAAIEDFYVLGKDLVKNIEKT